MSKILIRIAKYYLVKIIQLPVSLWDNLQWANLRFIETRHLIRLDDYLLKDMGLRKVNNRIEAIDSSRIDTSCPAAGSRTKRKPLSRPIQDTN